MLQRPGDEDVGFCTQSTVLSQLHLYSALSTASSLVKCAKFWHLLCFYSYDSSHAISDLGLFSDEILKKKLALFWLKCIKQKLLLWKLTTFWKSLCFIIILTSLSLPDCWLLKLEGSHLSSTSVRLIPLLYFFFTFHPPLCSKHLPCLLHRAQALCVQQLLSSLGELFPSPHTSPWMH